MKSCLVLLAALAACDGSVAALPSDMTTPEYTDSFVKRHDAWCKSHFCMFEATTYTPAGEGMFDIVDASLKRYQHATGRTDLTTDAQSGIPVLWKHDLWGKSDDGVKMLMCAQTYTTTFVGARPYTQVVYLDPDPPAGCPEPKISFLHELIHAMAPDAEHVSDSKSLFYSHTADTRIDYSALSELCSHFNCAAFKPE